MTAPRSDRPEVQTILARTDHAGALSRDDLAALARALGIGERQLPAQLRGGLLRIFFGESGRHPDA
jgi:hypothetical protein